MVWFDFHLYLSLYNIPSVYNCGCFVVRLAWPGLAYWPDSLVWSGGLLCIHSPGSVYIMVTSILNWEVAAAVACCWLWYLWPGMMTHVEYFHIYENVHICMHENKATSSSSSTPLYVVVVFFGTYLWLLVFVKQHRTDSSTVTERWEVFTNNFIIFRWEPGTEFWVVGV